MNKFDQRYFHTFPSVFPCHAAAAASASADAVATTTTTTTADDGDAGYSATCSDIDASLQHHHLWPRTLDKHPRLVDPESFLSLLQASPELPDHHQFFAPSVSPTAATPPATAAIVNALPPSTASETRSSNSTEESPTLKPISTQISKADRRRAQNRTAQRLFRQRKEQQLTNLIESIEKLESNFQALLGLYIDQSRALSGLIQSILNDSTIGSEHLEGLSQ